MSTITKTVDQLKLTENRRDFNTNRLGIEPLHLQTGDFFTYMPGGGEHHEYTVIVDQPNFLAIKKETWRCKFAHMPDRYIETKYYLFRPQEDGTYLLFTMGESLATVEFFANGETGDYVEIEDRHGRFFFYSPEDLAKYITKLESQAETARSQADTGRRNLYVRKNAGHPLVRAWYRETELVSIAMSEAKKRLAEWEAAKAAGTTYRRNYSVFSD